MIVAVLHFEPVPIPPGGKGPWCALFCSHLMSSRTPRTVSRRDHQAARCSSHCTFFLSNETLSDLLTLSQVLGAHMYPLLGSLMDTLQVAPMCDSLFLPQQCHVAD